MDLPDWIPITLDRLRLRRSMILAVAESHGASNVRVFGSVATGKADLLSDVDIAVDMKPDRNLLDIEGLTADLEDVLGWPVDLLVVTDKDDQPRLSVFLSRAIPL